MARQLETVLSGLAFAEGPRWHEGRLWFSDMHLGEVVAMTPDGVRETIYTHPTMVSGLGWLPDGRLLIVSMEDYKLLRREADGRVVEHANLSGFATGFCNDMVVDAEGRAYVGNFGFALGPNPQVRPAAMILAYPDGRVVQAADNLMFPNGTVITPDGKTLIVGESFTGRLTRFDIAAEGALSNRRLWAQIPGAIPDGICLDAEGYIWSASPNSSEVVRIAEGGHVAERLSTGQEAFACMLGGDDRRTLYVLTAASSDPERQRRERTGRIEATVVEVPGAGLP